jgi:DNA-binding NarL/FixJ family response regulator
MPKHAESTTVESASSVPELPRLATGLRRLIRQLSKTYPGIPLSALARSSAHLKSTPMTIDLAAARLIGMPIVVLRDRSPNPAQLTFKKLSKREREVAKLIVAGFGNAAISHKLGISIGTVKDHVHHALRKTRLRSRTELAAVLAREGI